MPLRHGLDVAIVSSSLETFTEYGVNTHARSKLVTAKIEARTGVQFFIAIRVENPFPAEARKRYGTNILTRTQAGDRPHLSIGETPLPAYKSASRPTRSDLDNNRSSNQRADERRLVKVKKENLSSNFDEGQLILESKEHAELSEAGIIGDRNAGHSKDNNHTIFAEAAEAAKARLAKHGFNVDVGALTGAITRNVEISVLPTRPSLLASSPTLPRSSDASSSKYILPKAPLSPKPPFDLIAEVFIDGRTKAEIRSTIYLNPSHPHYHDGKSFLKGRRVRTPDMSQAGALRAGIHDWIFTDVGIEVLLERMEVDDTTNLHNVREEDTEVAGLADMLQDAAKVVDTSKEEEEGGGGGRELKIGRIEVVFTRVVLGSLISGTAAVSSSLHDVEGAQQGVGRKSVGRDVTHTTSIVPPKPSSSSTAGAVAASRHSSEHTRIKWTHYNPDEDFYAKFTFDYTSRAKLVKWGLCDEKGVAVARANPRHKGREVSVGTDQGKGKEKKKKRKAGGDGEEEEEEEEAEEISPATAVKGVRAKEKGKGKEKKKKTAAAAAAGKGQEEEREDIVPATKDRGMRTRAMEKAVKRELEDREGVDMGKDEDEDEKPSTPSNGSMDLDPRARLRPRK